MVIEIYNHQLDDCLTAIHLCSGPRAKTQQGFGPDSCSILGNLTGSDCNRHVWLPLDVVFGEIHAIVLLCELRIVLASFMVKHEPEVSNSFSIR